LNAGRAICLIGGVSEFSCAAALLADQQLCWICWRIILATGGKTDLRLLANVPAHDPKTQLDSVCAPITSVC
jgi:hypothetical protein